MPQPLTETDIDRVIAMAWEDRTPFEAIEYQFGLTEADVIKLMKTELKENSWKRWRKRVSGRKTKHTKLRESGIDRFKADAQRMITANRISKKRY